MNSIIRQCIVYVLIALLPLQAAAASRMALCAATMKSDHAATSMAAHCAQLARANSESDNPTKLHHDPKQPGCWLGSICLAGLAAIAIPVSHQSSSAESHVAVFPPLTLHYLSIDLDDPQRPPTVL